VSDDPPLVLVRWVDSMGLESGGWMDADDVAVNLVEDALRQESIGYLVGDGDVAIALAGSRNLSDDDHDHRNTKLGNVIVIPRCAITHGPVALRISEAGGRGLRTGRRRERPAGTRRSEGRDNHMSDQQQTPTPDDDAQQRPPQTGDEETHSVPDDDDDDTQGDDDDQSS